MVDCRSESSGAHEKDNILGGREVFHGGQHFVNDGAEMMARNQAVQMLLGGLESARFFDFVKLVQVLWRSHDVPNQPGKRDEPDALAVVMLKAKAEKTELLS